MIFTSINMNICWKELHKYMVLFIVYVVSVNEYKVWFNMMDHGLIFIYF